ncbi:MAG: amidohydrolase family protein [Dehalococcoidia bacterium]
MIVDVHAQYHPRAYNAVLDRIAGRPLGGFVGGGFPDTDDEAHIEQRLQLMADAGVGMQVLSPAAGRSPYAKDQALAVEAAQIVNDANARLAARFPEQFKGFVSLPLPHIAASMDELRRGLDDLGMIGVNLHISALGRSVAEDEFLPIYEELDRRNGIIFYHPAGNGIGSPMITDYGFSGAVGTSMEDAVIVLHLIAKRIPARYPNITFIVPHLGGPIPMLLQRLDNQFSMERNQLPEPPSVTARRFYYDTVGHGSHAALTCACIAFGADHLLPGSDFTVLLAFETYARTFAWIREVGLPGEDVELILERNAPSVLRLES